VKVIILAGGFGTRISEETDTKPKPMVLLDENPILWHVMNIYASQGFTDFTIATGYLGDVIQNWVNELKSPWKVSAIDTGLETQTAGRIRKVFEILDVETCMVTYGDGLGNVDLKALLEFHRLQGRLATVTAVRPPARFGVLHSSNGIVTDFGEKNQADAGWINGGFFVLERKILEYIELDSDPFESAVLPKLVKDRQLTAFHHGGFWQPMDTLREKRELATLASQESPPWLLT